MNLYNLLCLIVVVTVLGSVQCCNCKSKSSESSEECGRHHRHSCDCEDEEETTKLAITTTKLANTTTTQTTTTTTVFNCQESSIDLVFVVDHSGSISKKDFNKTLTALVKTVANITVGSHDDESHIGLVTFNHNATKNFGLGEHLDTVSVQTAILQTKLCTGTCGTDISDGMNMALDEVFGQTGDRTKVPDVMIVITDGQDTSNVSGAQQMAANRGITVFAVGIGSGVNYNQLVEVAGAQERAYNVTTFDFIDEILADICSNLGGSNTSHSFVPPRPALAPIDQSKCVYDQKSGFTNYEFCTARPYFQNIC